MSLNNDQRASYLKAEKVNVGEVPEQNLRILLWDIDGTLVRSARPGSFKEYTVPVFEKVFGTAGRLRELTVSGMTDLQIVEESLRDEGFTRAEIKERLRDLQAGYLEAMEKLATDSTGLFKLIPGTREILEVLARIPRYRSAILTGNIEPAANLKLRITGLSSLFDLPGTYGNESYDRRELPQLAARRINLHLGMELAASQFIVIGDTPNDIKCAKHFGARVLAVGTGRTFSQAELLAQEPDALLPDLLDTELVIKTLGSL